MPCCIVKMAANLDSNLQTFLKRMHLFCSRRWRKGSLVDNRRPVAKGGGLPVIGAK
jgi:hypothetical protein